MTAFSHKADSWDRYQTYSLYVIFQTAEVAVPRDVFARILEWIQWFGVPPPLVQHC